MVRMKEDMIPKPFLDGELAEGKRLMRKPKFRYKDCMKSTLKKANILQNDWKNLAPDRTSRGKVVHNGKGDFQQNRFTHDKIK